MTDTMTQPQLAHECEQLTDIVHETAQEVNNKKYEATQLSEQLESQKLQTDYDIAFDKNLKNSEQRDVERRSQYEADDRLQSLSNQLSELNYQIKDLEVKLEYYRNKLKINLATLRTQQPDDT